MSSEHPVTGLVARAKAGDKQAWDALVERYAPLVWSICRRYRLDGADAADVSQNVWRHLLDHLGNLRNPAALPGWLATTTRRECGRVLRAARRPLAAGYDLDAESLPGEQAAAAEQELLAAERHAALREAVGGLPADCQRLIALLTADPPVPYAEISARLGIPVGSIGPTRRHCLDKLRGHPGIAALISAEADTTRGEIPDPVLARVTPAMGGRVSWPRSKTGAAPPAPAGRCAEARGMAATGLLASTVNTQNNQIREL